MRPYAGILVVLVAIFGLGLVVDEWGKQHPNTVPAKTDTVHAAQEQTVVQRFVPASTQANLGGIPWMAAVALDTKTGQLCKTFDFAGPQWAVDGLVFCRALYDSDDVKNHSRESVELLKKYGGAPR